MGRRRGESAAISLRRFAFAPRGGRAARLLPKPAGEIVWIFKAGLCRRVADRRRRAEGGLGFLQAQLIAQRAQAEPSFSL